ncbi:MAG: ABC transporter ATP-binding protein [Armatimonadota bacterium]
MSKRVIRVEQLSKRYQLGGREGPYRTLRETISGLATSPLRRFRRRSPGEKADRELWALKEVSFEVREGEVLGIIGRNGSGKSTLLKVMSRITEPTTGRVGVRGRVASLLEVGTGFHPELTGRENIYLNGAILGMSRQEIQRKFDEIVSFAEIEQFLDTPVKRYSSGMYTRLAFAVAAHLEPEILVIDEVLAVGDASFQRKCLNKMQDVGQEGRTVLFVSHNMPAVTRLCPRAVLLNHGKLLDDGPSSRVVTAYLNSGLGTTAIRRWDDPATAPGNEVARICSARVRTEDSDAADAIDIRRPVAIEMEYEVLQDGHVLVPHFSFHNEEGILLFVSVDQDLEWRGRPKRPGRYSSTAWVPGNFLAEGTVIVGTALTTHQPFSVHFYERDAVAFQVIDSPDGDSARADYSGHYPGLVRPRLQWETQASGRA